MKKILIIALGITLAINFTGSFVQAKSVRVATFNVSMEADNYRKKNEQLDGALLFEHLATGEHPQIKNIAQIIQRVRPDIILLNEFDYIADDSAGPKAFVSHYLKKSQGGQAPIDYPYFYYGPVNTGVNSGVDLNNDGKAGQGADDAFGYGRYPGQYGMLLLSRYPIDTEKVRTFQHFLWQDMPDNLQDDVLTSDGAAWYSDDAKAVMRLSSKSHWDVPIMIDGKTLHVLASHPTPPVFDGPENRNGKRNHDEIRFWSDYLTGAPSAQYIYDDNGNQGGFDGERFVILGDLNASKDEGDGMRVMMAGLLNHPKVAPLPLPASSGGGQNRADNPHGRFHTAGWGMTADYVIVSKRGLSGRDAGVFWPAKGQEAAELVSSREASSDHRLVWRLLNLD